jgi:hypothetical protein
MAFSQNYPNENLQFIKKNNMSLPPTSVSGHSGSPIRAGSATEEQREEYRNLRLTVDKRREDFLLYLSQSGVMDKLSKGKNLNSMGNHHDLL